MRLLVFAGFLGSGKTSLILRLAERLAAEGRTTCYVVNEVGEVGIDGRLMQDSELEVWEITAGCICCTIAVDLVTTLEHISEHYRPDFVIVEASGVATPSGVVGALEFYSGRPLEGPFTVTVLDATRLEAYVEVMTPLIEGQIAGADYVVVTKVDEASEQELAYARGQVARLRPDVPLRSVSVFDDRALDPLLSDLAGYPSS